MKQLSICLATLALVACGGGIDQASSALKVTAATFAQVQTSQQASAQPTLPPDKKIAADPFKEFLDANKK
jgi:hypothetical protein